VASVQGPQNLKFGGGVSESFLHPGVLVVVLIAGAMIVFWPRRKALAAFLAAGLLIPPDQVLLLGALHFPMLRVLCLFGFARIFKEKYSSKQRVFSGGVNKIDWVVILLTSMTAINGILLFQESGAIVYQLGNAFTIFGVYFLLRMMIRDDEDIEHAIVVLAFIACSVAVIMSFEWLTGHNPYAMLNGAAASRFAMLDVREGKVRAQGPFAHSILAGTFGAILVPLFIALWWKGKKYRKVTIMGVIAACVMTVTCNSSTPVLAYAAGVIGLCMWPIRTWMRAIRWSIVITLVTLHMVMKAPVWSLINHIDISGGSSGWHRYQLVDQCIRHFWDWWLVGVKDTSVWGWDMWDTANQYVGAADNSGLIVFILLIALLVYGFKYVGRSWRAARKDRARALFIWAIGSALLANAVAFFGISYFDQTMIAWYALLAMISAVAAVRPKKDAALIPVAVAGPAEDLVVQLAGWGELANHGADVQRSRGLNTLYERIP
jgi:hypothetical protein